MTSSVFARNATDSVSSRVPTGDPHVTETESASLISVRSLVHVFEMESKQNATPYIVRGPHGQGRNRSNADVCGPRNYAIAKKGLLPDLIVCSKSSRSDSASHRSHSIKNLSPKTADDPRSIFPKPATPLITEISSDVTKINSNVHVTRLFQKSVQDRDSQNENSPSGFIEDRKRVVSAISMTLESNATESTRKNFGDVRETVKTENCADRSIQRKPFFLALMDFFEKTPRELNGKITKVVQGEPRSTETLAFDPNGQVSPKNTTSDHKGQRSQVTTGFDSNGEGSKSMMTFDLRGRGSHGTTHLNPNGQDPQRTKILHPKSQRSQKATVFNPTGEGSVTITAFDPKGHGPRKSEISRADASEKVDDGGVRRGCDVNDRKSTETGSDVRTRSADVSVLPHTSPSRIPTEEQNVVCTCIQVSDTMYSCRLRMYSVCMFPRMYCRFVFIEPATSCGRRRRL